MHGTTSGCALQGTPRAGDAHPQTWPAPLGPFPPLLLDRRTGLQDRTAAQPWISLSERLSQDPPGAGEMEDAEHRSPRRSHPRAELLLPGSTLAQIRSPGDPQGTFNLGQDSYWINTMNM